MVYFKAFLVRFRQCFKSNIVSPPKQCSVNNNISTFWAAIDCHRNISTCEKLHLNLQNLCFKDCLNLGMGVHWNYYFWGVIRFTHTVIYSKFDWGYVMLAWPRRDPQHMVASTCITNYHLITRFHNHRPLLRPQHMFMGAVQWLGPWNSL